MKTQFSLRFTAYFKRSLYGSCLSSSVNAPSLEELEKKVKKTTKALVGRGKYYKSIVFDNHIEVSIEYLVSSRAITSRIVRCSRRKKGGLTS